MIKLPADIKGLEALVLRLTAELQAVKDKLSLVESKLSLLESENVAFRAENADLKAQLGLNSTNSHKLPTV